MKQLPPSIKKVKRTALTGAFTTKLTINSMKALSLDWKLLFVLLALMGLRLATIVAVVLQQL